MTSNGPGAGKKLAPFISSLLALIAAFVVGGIFLEARGKDALGAYWLMIERGLASPLGISETMIQVAPILLVSAGLLIALKAGVWNIGVDGQFLVGALLVGVVTPAVVDDVPRGLVWLIAALVGVLGGLLWALVPALLKVRYGLNEIITTLMLNYVAVSLTAWSVKGPFRDPNTVAPQTVAIPRASRLPDIPGTDVHVGLLVGIVAIVVVAFLFRSTTLGFKLWVAGQSTLAATHVGLPVGRLTGFALLASGGAAGLAGASDLLGVKGLFQGEWNPAYGLTAFALVYLARLQPLWVLPCAYFFSFLDFGGGVMARSADIPTYFVAMVEGLMLAFLAVAVALERRDGMLGWSRWRRARLGAVETSRVPADEST